MKYIRLMLLPLAWGYACIVEGIKLTYILGWRKSKRPEIPTVIVGNLSVGGTGKTPHVEYILKHLGQFYSTTVLARGYGRKSRGIHWVEGTDTVAQTGDEPLQIARKFPNISVVLAEKRVDAIPPILLRLPQTQLLLLDDAMQHWPILGDSYIMLTTFQNPFFRDFPLPAGNLREFRFNYKRANIIVVTKCPTTITRKEGNQFLSQIRPRPQQKVFFSYFNYKELYQFQQPQNRLKWDSIGNTAVFLLTGIANPQPLELELKRKVRNLKLKRYPDHYTYKKRDWEKISKAFLAFKEKQGNNTIFVSTEKDMTRLEYLIEASFPIYLAAVEVEIAFGEAAAFQRAIVDVIYKRKGYPT